MRLLQSIGFLFFGLLLGCSSDNDSGTLITEPVGAAHYYLKNTSSSDLNILFITSAELGMKSDSTKIALAGTSVRIFEDGIIGVNPQPTNSFSEISVYPGPVGRSEPLLVISPIVNENWNILSQDLASTGYGLTQYELVISEEDIN